ncbi:MAG: hypothetical protein WCA07_09530 [Gloeobacterales cyanobacterium]
MATDKGYNFPTESIRTRDEQYLQGVIHFIKNPNPKGQLLQWVCSENINALDLTQDRLELKPA